MVVNDASACKGRGRPCTKHGQCCSGGCGNKKRVKKKNGEFKKEKVGKCACSLTQESCNASKDCCDEADACGFNDCVDDPVCCKAAGFPCEDNCDCCFPSFCVDGRCDFLSDCSQTEEVCETVDDCCFEEDDCASNGCVEGKVCCGKAGAECEDEEDSCDCCHPLECVDGICVNPCSNSGQNCAIGGGSSQCCAQGDVCQTVVCNEEVRALCCHPTGPCEDDCDCCGPIECVNGVCGGSQ
jgi:hypothetical protein